MYVLLVKDLVLVQPRVATALRMLKQYLFGYQGHVGAYLVLGGVDITGPNLYTVHAHGSTDKLPYVSMGSGSLAAMATFEDRFRPDMEVSESLSLAKDHCVCVCAQVEEASQLVRDAIAAGIFNDLVSL